MELLLKAVLWRIYLNEPIWLPETCDSVRWVNLATSSHKSRKVWECFVWCAVVSVCSCWCSLHGSSPLSVTWPHTNYVLFMGHPGTQSELIMLHINCHLKSELECEAFRCSDQKKCLLLNWWPRIVVFWKSQPEDGTSSLHFRNWWALVATFVYVCMFACVSVCVRAVMWAEEGDILNDISVDRCGVAVPLNLALDYMFSQTASTAPRLEYPKFLPRQTIA